MKIKICSKEAKESAYWLRLLKEIDPANPQEKIQALCNEAIELKKIFSSILLK